MTRKQPTTNQMIAEFAKVLAVPVTKSGSVECPHCHWGFAPQVIDQHIREKH
jgi:hypothetical protein